MKSLNKSLKHGQEMRRLAARDKRVGVLVQGAKGRIFFLSKEQARKAAVPPGRSKLLRKLQKKAGGPPPPRPLFSNCKNLLRWLLTHNPNSQRWRAVCAWWIDEC